MTRNNKFLIVALTTAAYCAIFLYFYRLIGGGIAAAGVLPVAVAGLLFNRRVGIAAGVATFVLNTLLFNLVGEQGLLVVLSQGGSVGQLVIVLIGAVTGWISELRQRERKLLAEQRRLASELHDERDFLDSIMQTSVAAIVVFNAEGEIVFANDRAEEIVGHARGRLTGNSYSAPASNVTSLEGHDFPDENLPFAQVIATGEPVFDNQLSIERPDGQHRILSVNAAPVFDDSGEIHRVVCAVDDVTEQRTMQKALRENERRFRALVQKSSDIIMILDYEGVITYVSPPAKQIVGYEPEEMVGRQGFHYVHSDDIPTARAALSALLQKPQRTQTMELRFKHKDGSWRVLEATGRNLLHHPAVSGIVTNSRDVTDRKEMEHALRRRAEEAETLRKAGAAVAATLQPEETFERILEQLKRVVPYDTAAVDLLHEDHLELVAGRGFADTDAVIGLRFPLDGDNPGGTVVERCEPVVLGNAPEEYPVFRREPHTHIKSWIGIPLVTKDRIIGLMTLDSTKCDFFTEEHVRLATAFADQVAIALDNAQLYARMQTLARTDSLTGVANRRAFFERSEREIERARRFGRPLTVLMIDIDHFKRVNDTYGHAIGDEVLTKLAQRCRQQLRMVDVFGRYGGEEFAALLSEADVNDACIVAERLRKTISTPIHTDAGAVSVTTSMGIAALDPANPDLDTVLQRADQALYRAKEAGRDRVEICDDGVA